MISKEPLPAPDDAQAERPGLDESLCFAVYSANHAFNRVYKPLLDALGLTYPQYLTLLALWAEDDQTVGSLGGKLFLESSTLTPLLKRLEAMGHVVRRRDPADERQVRVQLTQQGRALQHRACEVPGNVSRACGRSPKALRKLNKQLVDLREALRGAHLCDKDHAADDLD
ncbi:MAG: MarR family transcriptional regulator [Rhodospirillaceae bacterium]|nr:MarR family transcriptional regulator [Rhodospirillaceae bacterium]